MEEEMMEMVRIFGVTFALSFEEEVDSYDAVIIVLGDLVRAINDGKTRELALATHQVVCTDCTRLGKLSEIYEKPSEVSLN